MDWHLFWVAIGSLATTFMAVFIFIQVRQLLHEYRVAQCDKLQATAIALMAELDKTIYEAATNPHYMADVQRLRYCLEAIGNRIIKKYGKDRDLMEGILKQGFLQATSGVNIWLNPFYRPILEWWGLKDCYLSRLEGMTDEQIAINQKNVSEMNKLGVDVSQGLNQLSIKVAMLENNLNIALYFLKNE